MKALNFLKEKTKGIAHNDQEFHEHCYNVYKILKKLGQNEDVCLAGLYHSIYDTDAFKLDIKIDRKEVVEQIGKRAEDLVWSFCQLDNKENYLLQEYPNLKDLFYISYANMLEQRNKLQETDIETMIAKYEHKLTI